MQPPKMLSNLYVGGRLWEVVTSERYSDHKGLIFYSLACISFRDTHILTLEFPISTWTFSILFSLYFYGTSWESLFKNQGSLSLLIISFILMTHMLDQVVILYGEITS